MVLVAGANVGANELLSRILEADGYRTVTATTPVTTTERAGEHLPRAAVVDLGGSGIGTGLRLLDFFRSHDDPRLARCRVVVLAPSSANRTFCFHSGADDFLQRPFHARDLLESVSEVLATPVDELPERRRRLLEQEPASL